MIATALSVSLETSVTFEVVNSIIVDFSNTALAAHISALKLSSFKSYTQSRKEHGWQIMKNYN